MKYSLVNERGCFMLGIFFAPAGMIAGDGTVAAGLLALGATFLFLYFLISVGAYVFTSLMFKSLAKKAGDSSPNLAWIPGVGPLIIAFRASKMHWWPWLLLIGVIIPFVGIIAMIAFVVFEIIWLWKLLEAVGRPGWWVLLMFIPIVGIIMFAIAAWGHSDAKATVASSAPVSKESEKAA